MKTSTLAVGGRDEGVNCRLRTLSLGDQATIKKQ